MYIDIYTQLQGESISIRSIYTLYPYSQSFIVLIIDKSGFHDTNLGVGGKNIAILIVQHSQHEPSERLVSI